MNNEEQSTRPVVQEPTELSPRQDCVCGTGVTGSSGPDFAQGPRCDLSSDSPKVGQFLLDIVRSLPAKEHATYDVRYVPTGEVLTVFFEEEGWHLLEAMPQTRFSEPVFEFVGETKLSGTPGGAKK